MAGAPIVSSTEKKLSKKGITLNFSLPLDNTLVYCYGGEVSAQKEVVKVLFSRKALMVRGEKTHQAGEKRARRASLLCFFFARSDWLIADVTVL